MAFSKEIYGISEDNRARTKYVIRDKDLPTELANSHGNYDNCRNSRVLIG